MTTPHGSEPADNGGASATPSKNFLQRGLASAVGLADINTTLMNMMRTLNVISATLGSNSLLEQVTVLTTGTSFVPSNVTKGMLVFGVGGGGGGGGAGGSVGDGGVGSGGSAGAEGYVIISPVGGSYAYSIGLGGTGGTAGPNNGAAGGTTTFGSTLLVLGGGPGGLGGTAVAGADVTAVLAGGVASAGTFIRDGQSGDCGIQFGTGGIVKSSGRGGSSSYGAGGRSRASAVATPNNGFPGLGYGSGGSGGIGGAGTPTAGGNGAPGVIIVWEFS